MASQNTSSKAAGRLPSFCASKVLASLCEAVCSCCSPFYAIDHVGIVSECPTSSTGDMEDLDSRRDSANVLSRVRGTLPTHVEFSPDDLIHMQFNTLQKYNVIKGSSSGPGFPPS